MDQFEPVSLEDKQSAQLVQQALKDDQALYAAAHGIGITVKNGTITLDGEVSTPQLMNLAINTAAAIGADEKVKNNIEVKLNDEQARADDDGFAVKKET